MRADCFIRGIQANGDDELNLARNMDAGILARFVPGIHDCPIRYITGKIPHMSFVASITKIMIF